MSGDLQALSDRAAIQDLIYCYSDAVTRADYAQMATVFADDAVWESPILGMHFETAREFIDFQADGSSALDVLIQTASNPVIDLLTGDRATARTNIREIIRGTSTNDGPYGPTGTAINVDQYGVYFDGISKFDGMWKFTRRSFVPILIAQGTIAGDIVTPRPIARPS
jgi:ketosteroid isomerase-like protein